MLYTYNDSINIKKYIHIDIQSYIFITCVEKYDFKHLLDYTWGMGVCISSK